MIINFLYCTRLSAVYRHGTYTYYTFYNETTKDFSIHRPIDLLYTYISHALIKPPSSIQIYTPRHNTLNSTSPAQFASVYPNRLYIILESNPASRSLIGANSTLRFHIHIYIYTYTYIYKKTFACNRERAFFLYRQRR